ncbi:MAG: M48 family metallopeptidase [Opitutaceae bacterium]
MNIPPRFLFSLLVLGLISGCYNVPVTGRKAMNLVDDKEVTKMSIAAFEGMKKQYPVSRDRARIEQLNRIGERLAKIVFWDMPDAEWEFVVFDVPQQINAFAMAGGKVGVFSGLYKIIENDDQLASVLAHEISHVTAKHIHQRLSSDMLAQTGGVIGSVALMGSGAGLLTTAAIQEVYGLSTGVTALAFDRAKEKEADYIGLIYMAKAGYNPEESVKVLEKLDAETSTSGKNLPPAFLSTHPSNPERILQLLDEMPKALEVRRNAGQTAAPVLVK